MKNYILQTLAFILILALWILTFVVAYSDCTVQEFAQARCFSQNQISLEGADTASPLSESNRTKSLAAKLKVEEATEKKTADASEKKGQFGDFFGVLNALFGAFTLLFVYSNLVASKQFNKVSVEHQEKTLNEAKRSTQSSISLQLRANYYADINVAIQTYHRLLGEVLVPVKDEEGRVQCTWAARHGLFHLWHHFMARELREVHVQKSQVGTCEEIWKDPATLTKYMADNSEGYKKLTELAKNQWITLYRENKYQLDALFRSWSFVHRTISREKANQEMDEATRKFAAASWYAQLSQVEFQFLVAHATFGEDKAFHQLFSQVAQDPSFAELIDFPDLAMKVLLELCNPLRSITKPSAIPPKAQN